MKPRRIFMGFAEVAGYYHNLAEGFRRLGLDCVFVNAYGHRFGYGEEPLPNVWLKLLKWCGTGRVQTPKSQLLKKALFALGFEVAKVPVLIWAIATRDVFIFGFGSSFFGYRELPWLKRLGKTIVFTFHGSDSRPPYMDGAVMSPRYGYTIADCLRLTARKKAAVRMIDRYADVVIEQASAGHFHERPFVQFLAIGLPYRLEAPVVPPSGEAVRILHSPSHPEAKGTEDIRAAIRALQARGLAIEWIEVTGVPNQVVLEEIARCDFVVDQAYSDTPMAGFAAEAAWLGKPAIVGGYYAERYRQDVPEEAWPPSMYVHPDTLESAIEQLVRDADYRRALGARAQAFVRERWAPEVVAARYVRLLDGDVPPAWTFDPSGAAYVHGVGLSEAKSRALVRGVLEAGGTSAFQVDDKPAFLQALLAFAGKGRA